MELLDDYFLRISELLQPCDAADLNQRLRPSGSAFGSERVSAFR